MNEKNLSIIERRKRSEPTKCQICDSPAIYSYFGVISCDACKVFFRRNAHYAQDHLRLQCIYDGQCEIKTTNRHICSSCRLAKCFEKGMKIEMIRRSIVNKKRNILSKSNRLEKISRMNLVEKNTGVLDDSQRNLLSNLVQNYSDNELPSVSQTIKNQIDSFKMINLSTLQCLITCFYETTGQNLRSNVDFVRLQSDDRSILLHTAVANIICAGGQLIYYYSHLINYDVICKYLEDIYGKTIIHYGQLSSKFAQSDMIICKLSIALFALSTNTRIFCRNIQGEYRDIHQILKIQDKYAELSWKYLLYKYDHREAMKRYIRMIEWFLSLTSIMQYACNVDVYVNDVESLVEQTEMALILDDVDRVVNEGISSTKTSELISSMDLEM